MKHKVVVLDPTFTSEAARAAWDQRGRWTMVELRCGVPRKDNRSCWATVGIVVPSPAGDLVTVTTARRASPDQHPERLIGLDPNADFEGRPPAAVGRIVALVDDAPPALRASCPRHGGLEVVVADLTRVIAEAKALRTVKTMPVTTRWPSP